MQGINLGGEIVGYYYDSNGVQHGFTDINGTFTTVDDPAGVNGVNILGVNNAGDLVGVYVDASFNEFSFEDAGGAFTSITDPGAPSGSVPIAYDINSGGSISGVLAASGGSDPGFVDTGGVFSLFTGPGSPEQTVAVSIDNDGDLAGYLQTSNLEGFVDFGGTLTTVDDPNASGQGTTAFGLNDHNVVVGAYSDSSGHSFGFVGTPIAPEPPTAVLFALGLCGAPALAARRRTRTSAALTT